tara:strand:- start:798 stop:1271 length:474 start_codon:yes stop_codon:yes gene_type:complete
MAIQLSYGTSNQTITLTQASLADGSARESTSVDNTTNKFVDAMVAGKTKANASGTSSTGFLSIFAYATADGGTTYTDAATGTDSAHTINNNLKFMGSVELNANSETAQWGPFSLAKAFGGLLPDEWGIVIENNSGAALDSTGGNHAAFYQGIEFESA